jgi:hypothetical protein
MKLRYKRFFIEGKQQAIQLLKKVKLSDTQIKAVLETFELLDPTTPKNKYFEVLTKILIDYMMTNGDNLFYSVSQLEKDFTEYNTKEKIKSIEKRNLKIDLTKIKKYNDFFNIIEETEGQITTSKQKFGLSGIRKDKDYIEIPLNDSEIRAFIPLNYDASKVIASNKVGQCEGKWCTAYQKTNEHWEQYIEQTEGILVYIINYGEAHPTDYKQAIYFYPDKHNIEMFNADDRSIHGIFYGDQIKKYVYHNWDNIRESYKLLILPKTLNYNILFEKEGGYGIYSYLDALEKIKLFLKKRIIQTDPWNATYIYLNKKEVLETSIAISIIFVTKPFKDKIYKYDNDYIYDEKELNLRGDTTSVKINKVFYEDLKESSLLLGFNVKWF